MSSLPQNVRQSAPWLPSLDFEEDHEQQQAAPSPKRNSPPKVRQRHSSQNMLNTRRSMQSLANLPPQLRASVFFEQQPVQHNVELQGESAVATLDSILAASVNAPVSAFTDHPYAGQLGDDFFAREKVTKRNTMSTPLVADARNQASMTAEAETDRATKRGTGLFGRSRSQDLTKMQRRSSMMSVFTDLTNPEGKRLQKRNSRMSLGNEFEYAPGGEEGQTPEEHEMDELVHDYDQAESGAQRGEEGLEDDEDELPDNLPAVYAAPTTLLAELQVRKAQQKLRNKTAATAFPNGMHSTLLELDAVAQIEKAKRKNNRPALAWEDPNLRSQQDGEADEDVPLGVLFGNQKGLVSKGRPGMGGDWDRPLGLIERRQMEDNEPLSSRRNRLKGVDPRLVRSRTDFTLQHQQSGMQPEDGEDESLPLAERLRRLKQKEALNGALGDAAQEDKRSGFADDLMSQFGLEPKEPTSGTATPAPPPEDETLGQRRARLQREREGTRNVSDPAATAARPPLRATTSMANLLASHPVGANAGSKQVGGPAPFTLLSAHERAAEENKVKLRQQNAQNVRRTSYMGASRQPSNPQQLQQASSQAFTPGFPAGMPTSVSMPVGLSNQSQGYFGLPGQQQQQQQQYMGMNMGMATSMGVGAGYNPQQQMMNPLAYQQFTAATPYGNMAAGPGFPMQAYGYPGMPMGMGFGGMGMPMGMGMGMGVGMGMPADYMSMDPSQRDKIDRWRSSVAQQ